MSSLIESCDELESWRNVAVEQAVHDAPFPAFTVSFHARSTLIGKNDIVGNAVEKGEFR
jgi:hypothetical protein